MSEEILINQTSTESRVAVVEDGVLQEIYIERHRSRGIVGNIYRGKVIRILPGMQAAFVDVGLDKACFLHASDIITNHDKENRQQEIQADIHCELFFINALTAKIDFKKNRDYHYTHIPNVNSSTQCKRALLSLHTGRLGIQGKLTWDKSSLQNLIQHWQPKQNILVLGTGEFMHLCFLIGQYLNQQGWQVKIQSTARSPLLKGQAIKQKMELTDNYADNIPNYLYNVQVGQYQQVIICHETPLCAALQQFAHRLNAHLLYYTDGKISIS